MLPSETQERFRNQGTLFVKSEIIFHCKISVFLKCKPFSHIQKLRICWIWRIIDILVFHKYILLFWKCPLFIVIRVLFCLGRFYHYDQMTPFRFLSIYCMKHYVEIKLSHSTHCLWQLLHFWNNNNRNKNFMISTQYIMMSYSFSRLPTLMVLHRIPLYQESLL